MGINKNQINTMRTFAVILALVVAATATNLAQQKSADAPALVLVQTETTNWFKRKWRAIRRRKAAHARRVRAAHARRVRAIRAHHARVRAARARAIRAHHAVYALLTI